jgi:hypothetical protein
MAAGAMGRFQADLNGLAVSAPDEAAQTPHHGMTPIFFSSTATAGGSSSGGVVFDLRVPTGAIEDVVTVLLRHI